jgi:hypothetical protein
MIMDSKREEKGKMLKYLFWDMFVYRKKWKYVSLLLVLSALVV